MWPLELFTTTLASNSLSEFVLGAVAASETIACQWIRQAG
jgi:hypothetical protein